MDTLEQRLQDRVRGALKQYPEIEGLDIDVDVLVEVIVATVLSELNIVFVEKRGAAT